RNRYALLAAKVLPSGENASPVVNRVCFLKDASSWPLVASRSLTVPVSSPVANILPSGEKARSLIRVQLALSCWSVSTSFPVAASRSLTAPLLRPVARFPPSGEKARMLILKEAKIPRFLSGGARVSDARTLFARCFGEEQYGRILYDLCMCHHAFCRVASGQRRDRS